MPNYKETNITGYKWTRCNSVQISNPLNSTPTIIFCEEEVVDMGDNNFHVPLSSSLVDSIDPSKEIKLLNPNTGEPTGQVVTEGFLYVALFSKYMALAAKRDELASIVPETMSQGSMYTGETVSTPTIEEMQASMGTTVSNTEQTAPDTQPTEESIPPQETEPISNT